MHSVMDEISYDAGHDGKHKKNDEYYKRLIRNHGKHDECFVA